MPPANKSLTEIADVLLRHIISFLDPLPDIFNASATCKRLRDVALTRRSWLVVTHDLTAPTLGIPSEYRQQFTSLDSAVQASRPGDTIVIQPSSIPYHASNILINHPLHILGGGSDPSDVIIHGPKGAAAVLIFASTGRVTNLTIEANLGACVAHYRGKVTIERCWLRCFALGLPHLATPLVTYAITCSPSSSSCKQATARAPRAQQKEAIEASSSSLTNKIKKDEDVACQQELHQAISILPGPGQLSLMECTLQGGGGTAVQLHGTGCVSSVRVLYGAAKDPVFWFEVDSAVGCIMDNKNNHTEINNDLKGEEAAETTLPINEGTRGECACATTSLEASLVVPSPSPVGGLKRGRDHYQQEDEEFSNQQLKRKHLGDEKILPLSTNSRTSGVVFAMVQQPSWQKSPEFVSFDPIAFQQKLIQSGLLLQRGVIACDGADGGVGSYSNYKDILQRSSEVYDGDNGDGGGDAKLMKKAGMWRGRNLSSK